jgi:hypothetical protein
MLKAVEAIIDENGHVQLLEKIKIKGTHRAVITIFDETLEEKNLTALLSEESLASDWEKPEEDKAWKHLQ